MQNIEDFASLEKKFQEVMRYENYIATVGMWQTYDARVIYNIAKRVMEVAKNSFVLRGYNGSYGLTMRSQSCAYESVGAHTNLLTELVDQFLVYSFGENVDKKEPFGHRYRSIMNAVRRHDLPENEIRDIPDNGSGDTNEKRNLERHYYFNLSFLTNDYEIDSEIEITDLLNEMTNKTTAVGKMLYTADKAAATIITLCYDLRGTSPRMKLDCPYASERDKEEMALCDDKELGSCRASEMWTIDYLKLRQITKYDTYGFFTALIVMVTLIVNHKWYDWREKDYEEVSPF